MDAPFHTIAAIIFAERKEGMKAYAKAVFEAGELCLAKFQLTRIRTYLHNTMKSNFLATAGKIFS